MPDDVRLAPGRNRMTARAKSPFIRDTPPEALLLRVDPADDHAPGQYQINNQHSKLADFDREYVSFGGYFGLHDPQVFAAAPQLLEALSEVVKSYDAANPMRMGDFHKPECLCVRCVIDRARAAIAASGV